MPHIAKALILHCMDFRFIDQLHQWLNSSGLKNQYDLVSIAGAAKNLVDPTSPSDREFVLRQIRISKELHDIKEVWLVNHRDCGGYRGYALADERAEYEFHRRHLQQAARVVTENVPGLKVKCWLAGLPTGPLNQVEVQEIK